MEPASFEYFAPTTLRETLDLLTQHGDDAKLLAGGQSLLPTMKLRLAQPRYVVDLAKVGDLLSGIRVDGDQVVIGALTLHADVAVSDVIRGKLPGLADAASGIGDVQVCNRGTIGGSVAHADPGADFPVILTALDALIVAVSPRGTRTIPIDGFFTDFFTTALASDEVLTEIRVPLPPTAATTGYAKLGNPASGYVVVSAGVLLVRGTSGACESARIAVGGLQATPFRASRVEEGLRGQQLTTEAIAAAASNAADGADPYGDAYASENYKRQMAVVYVRRALDAALARNGSVR